MSFLDTLLGRTKPVPPNLDNLFSLPGAAITLEAGTDFRPTGSGSVCFRSAEGRAFSEIEKDVRELLTMGGDKKPADVSRDSFGFTWLVCHHDPGDAEGLVTDLHAVNSSLELGGFGPQLLCTIMAFRNSENRSLQARDFLPVRPGRRRAPGQCPGAADPRRARRRPEDRGRPGPVVPRLGRPRAVIIAARPGRAVRNASRGHMVGG
jgi:hypothetical protein